MVQGAGCRVQGAGCRVQGGPGHPAVPVFLHLLPPWQGDLPPDELDDPKGAYLEHGVGVVPAEGGSQGDGDEVEDEKVEDYEVDSNKQDEYVEVEDDEKVEDDEDVEVEDDEDAEDDEDGDGPLVLGPAVEDDEDD